MFVALAIRKAISGLECRFFRARSLGLACEVLEDYSEMAARKDIDFLVITTPHNLHFQQIVEAAEAGKHVVVEKPIGMNWQEIVQVRDVIRKTRVKFQCGLVLRFNPFVENLRRLIDRGAIGEIFHLEVDYFHSLREAWGGFRWGVHKKSGGPSASLVAGIHAVDLLCYLCGEVSEVSAYGTTAHRTDFEYPPSYLAALRFENGAVGKSSSSFETRCPYLLNLLLHGTKGSVFNERFYLKDLLSRPDRLAEFRNHDARLTRGLPSPLSGADRRLHRVRGHGKGEPQQRRGDGQDPRALRGHRPLAGKWE